MGFFSKFSTPKVYTGVVIKKDTHTFTDSEDDKVTRFKVTFKFDTGDGVERERTENVSQAIYDKVEIGNKVTKTAEDKQPVIHLGN